MSVNKAVIVLVRVTAMRHSDELDSRILDVGYNLRGFC